MRRGPEAQEGEAGGGVVGCEGSRCVQDRFWGRTFFHVGRYVDVFDVVAVVDVEVGVLAAVLFGCNGLALGVVHHSIIENAGFVEARDDGAGRCVPPFGHFVAPSFESSP